MPDGPAPAPRRRPRDRRDRILAAADVRFRRDGYHDTSMSDVASDVGIGASALYRHVRTKQELLHVVMLRSFDLVLEAVSTPDDLDGCLAALAEFSARMQPGDILAMEDGVLDDLGISERYDGGPNRALGEYLAAHPGVFEIAEDLCDMFGPNATYKPNGYLRKL